MQMLFFAQVKTDVQIYQSRLGSIKSIKLSHNDSTYFMILEKLVSGERKFQEIAKNTFCRQTKRNDTFHQCQNFL